MRSLQDVTRFCASEINSSPSTERMDYTIGAKAGIEKELDKLVVTADNQYREMVLFSVGLVRYTIAFNVR